MVTRQLTMAENETRVANSKHPLVGTFCQIRRQHFRGCLHVIERWQLIFFKYVYLVELLKNNRLQQRPQLHPFSKNSKFLLCISTLGMLKNSQKVAIHNLESTVSKKVNENKKNRKFSCAYACGLSTVKYLNWLPAQNLNF